MNQARRVLLLLACFGMPTAVAAHAMLERASPRVGSTVGRAPPRVELWFSEPLEAAFSALRVVDAGGRRVDGRNAAVDEDNRRHLRVSMTDVPPGRYRVIWRVVSVDTHVTEGDFTFDVAP
jgi:methionine-rich copper-binding protein CopC